MDRRPQHTKLGQLLVQRGVVAEWQFLAAMGSRKPGQRLGEVMIERRFLSEEQLFETLAFQHGLPFIRIAGRNADPSTVKAMPGHVARRFLVYPLALRPAKDALDVPTLVVAMTDPGDLRVIDALRFLLELDIEPVFATREEIRRAIEKTYGDDDPGSADCLPIPVPRSNTGPHAGPFASRPARGDRYVAIHFEPLVAA